MSVDPRYDELMRGFYIAQLPTWLPLEKSPWFVRESRRRRTELIALLKKRWPCASYYARCAVDEEFAAHVCRAFGTDTRPAASLVRAIHSAMLDVLGRRSNAAALDLVRYESLLESDVPLPSGIVRGGVTLIRLGHDVPTAYPHLQHLRTALAPPSMILEYPLERTPVWVAVKDAPGRRIVAPVEEPVLEQAA